MTQSDEHGPDGGRGHGHHGFDPGRLLAMEERRRDMLPPDEILKDFVPATNLVLLDLGCGAGYFTLPAAKLLVDGKVYAVDLQQNMVDTTLERAGKEDLSNIEGIAAPAAHVPLPDNSVDIVLMSMVFHDIDGRPQALQETLRLLRPGGTLCMIEMDRSGGEFGPPMEIRIPPGELSDMLASAGFTVIDIRNSARQEGVYFLRARPGYEK